METVTLRAEDEASWHKTQKWITQEGKRSIILKIEEPKNRQPKEWRFMRLKQ
jgi:hypothetical protein